MRMQKNISVDPNNLKVNYHETRGDSKIAVEDKIIGVKFISFLFLLYIQINIAIISLITQLNKLFANFNKLIIC